MSESGLADVVTAATGSASNSTPSVVQEEQDNIERDLSDCFQNRLQLPSLNQLPELLYKRFNTKCITDNVNTQMKYDKIITEFINFRNRNLHPKEYDQYKSGINYNELINIINKTSKIDENIITKLSDEIITNLLFKFLTIQEIYNEEKINDVKQFIINFIKFGTTPKLKWSMLQYKFMLQSIQLPFQLFY